MESRSELKKLEVQEVQHFTKEMKDSPMDVGMQPVGFKPSSWGTFDAEVSMEEGNFIVHFYQPLAATDVASAKVARPAANGRSHFAQEYWDNTFPEILTQVAREHFRAEYPRIAAKRILEEGVMVVPQRPLAQVGNEYQLQEKGRPLDSWWFMATGFASVLDPEAYLTRFYQSLDHALRKRIG